MFSRGKCTYVSGTGEGRCWGNEIHVYPFGGHGYGMRKTANPVSDWPKRVEVWMRSTGWL